MDAADETWRDELLRIVATVAAIIAAAPLPRVLWRRAARLLLPAESATRRLLVLMARGLAAKPRPPRPLPVHLFAGGRFPCGPRTAFPLADPLKRFGRRRRRAAAMPRISVPGFAAPAPLPAPRSDPAQNCAALARRVEALTCILGDLPRAARRMARWQARQRALRSEPPPGAGPKGRRRVPRSSPLRPGWPPGRRTRPGHAVDNLLASLHAHAFEAQTRPPPA